MTSSSIRVVGLEKMQYVGFRIYIGHCVSFFFDCSAIDVIGDISKVTGEVSV